MAIIQPTTLIKVQELFNDKQWPTNLATTLHLNLFEKYCERLKLFSANQQDLIIQLTYNFREVKLNDYYEYFFDSLLLLGDALFNSNEKIFIFPLVNPFIENSAEERTSRGKTKSASFLHYLLSAHENRWFSDKLIFEDSIDKLKESFSNNDSVLVLIDDYVGSGQTAIDICNTILEEEFNNEKINHTKIKIVVLAAQKAGIDKVKDSIGIDVVSNIVLNKGISDMYTGEDLNNKIACMIEIERELKIIEKYKFGYEQTEGLITFMNKTPNNTFPVYWYETRTKIAPFPRLKIFK